MCFSAGASFGASVVLGIVGVVSIKKTTSENQLAFASIPLLFSVQQAAEGMLWLALSGTDYESWKHFPVYVFLILAQFVWPFWVPFSLLLIENDLTRKKIIKILLGFGTGISLYLVYCMFAYGVKAEIQGAHIRYILDFPSAFAWISGMVYFTSIVVPLFISSNKGMTLLGLSVLVSFLISKIYFEEHLISVWCFFAALLSIAVVFIVSKFEKTNISPPN